MRVKKISENFSDSDIWKDILNGIKSGDVKLIGTEFDTVERISAKNFIKPIENGIIDLDWFVIVFKEYKPVAIISQYEMMNSFVFKNVVVCPGRDSIVCYDIESGEYKKEHIR